MYRLIIGISSAIIFLIATLYLFLMYGKLNDYEIIMSLISNAVILGASIHFLKRSVAHQNVKR